MFGQQWGFRRSWGRGPILGWKHEITDRKVSGSLWCLVCLVALTIGFSIFLMKFDNLLGFLRNICWGILCSHHQLPCLLLSIGVCWGTITTTLHLLDDNSVLPGGRNCVAALALVQPHVLDRWCAGLVVLVVKLFFLPLSLVSNFDPCHCQSLAFVCCPSRLGNFVRLSSPKRPAGMGRRSRWWMVLVSLMLLHRGEALNPGPGVSQSSHGDRVRSWSMGTFNPSGLGGKHQVVSSYLNHGDLWAVTETHLTSQGMRSFKQGLKWSNSEFAYCIGGEPVPLRSHSGATGSWNGVSVLSKFPTRAVPVPWGDQVFETSRVQLTATLCEDMWITGGVMYGEPPGASHPSARANTDTIALDVVSHLCQLSGLRFFAGDFNFEPGGLEVFQVLEDAGFKDIQDVAFEKWGKPIMKTCKQSTRKDYFFVSRELIPHLVDVVVDPTVWADHAVLQGFFSCKPEHLTRHYWRQPQPVVWPEKFHVSFSSQFHQEADATQKYTCMWKEIESAASCTHVSEGGSALTKQQVGRGGTLSTRLIKAPYHLGPVRAGRVTDIQPIYAGLSQQHAHWFRQLRRIQSFVNFRKVHVADTHTGHGVSLWSSILRAKGFEESFAKWWTCKSSRVFGAPDCLPLCPPPWDIASRIYESFLIDVRTLESNLRSKRHKHAKDKRKELAHLIFKDIRRAAPDRVDVLLKTVQGEVLSVDPITNSIQVTPNCHLTSEHSVFVGGQKFTPLQVRSSQVWFASIAGIEPGQPIRQSVFTGQAQDMFKAFGDEWSKRWDRHKNVPPSQWDQICRFSRQMFTPQPILLSSWETSMLQAELARKKSRSATGLDGVSLSDLKALPAEGLEAHCQIYRTAESCGEWPSQALVGKVASLAKSEAPDSISGFRPITVLPHCYRLWSGVRAKALLHAMGDRCPSFLFGNRPHCQASMVWTHLAWAVEESFSTEVPIAGIVADIEKAFNHLPREVVFQTAVALGIPFQVLTAWASAMGGLIRRFQVRESLGPPIPSHTGFPEGCALSCLAMLLMDCVFHKWFEHQFPMCQPISYVDDLQILTRDPQRVPDMLSELHSFAALVDLTVDEKKTFVWSNSAYFRASFRRQSIKVKKHARGLGAQLQFGKLHSTEIIRNRINEIKPLWPRLCQSLSPYKVKVLAIKQAAWSRCLHGIAATSISSEAFVSLRTQAMRGLNADGAGCNPCVHLGLIEQPLLDPFCWTIAATCRTVRECATRDSLAILLKECVSGQSRLPAHGMTSILVSRLHYLGWEFTHGVNCHDGLSEFSLLDISFPELLLRMTWSWQKCVASSVSHRATFQGLEISDPVLTREFVSSLSVCDQGLMRKALNGALFTNDSLCYFSQSGSSVCPFCGEEDSRFHRFWQCKVFTDDRVVQLPGFWDDFDSLPMSLLCHGWAIRPTTWFEWNRCLLELSFPSVELTAQPIGQTWIDLFTDGSCLWPTNRAMRVASWAIVEASPCGAVNNSQVVWAGPVCGLLQSAYRAELQAVNCAVRYALYWRRRVRIWSDCLSVVRKFKQLVYHNRVLKPNGPHYDLWAEILETVKVLGVNAICITKVAAHQDVSVVPSAFENWAFQHNIVVDRAARLSNLQRDKDFWTLHKQHCGEARWVADVSQVVQTVILQISRRVVARETVLAADMLPTEQEVEHVAPLMQAAAPMWDGFKPGHPIPEGVTRRFGYRFVAKLIAWLRGALGDFTEGGQTTWLSVHQLYLDFQHQTGELGLVHHKVWKDPEILPGLKLSPKSFKRRSAWFGSAIRAIYRAYGTEIPWMVTRPCSTMIALHTSCLAIPWPQWRLAVIEQWLMLHLPAKKAATRGGLDLVHLPPAKQDSRWPVIESFAGPLGS